MNGSLSTAATPQLGQQQSLMALTDVLENRLRGIEIGLEAVLSAIDGPTLKTDRGHGQVDPPTPPQVRMRMENCCRLSVEIEGTLGRIAALVLG